MFPDSVSDAILNWFDNKMIKYQSSKLEDVLISDIRIEDILNHQIQVPIDKIIIEATIGSKLVLIISIP